MYISALLREEHIQSFLFKPYSTEKLARSSLHAHLRPFMQMQVVEKDFSNGEKSGYARLDSMRWNTHC